MKVRLTVVDSTNERQFLRRSKQQRAGNEVLLRSMMRWLEKKSFRLKARYDPRKKMRTVRVVELIKEKL